ncbi:hypothetical protein C6V04_05090 [Burkholderia multivorans]|uniref:hypothetical protein n=1 Tax=Burkholderia cepacia complex TaxID=87882 RepID=UPI000D011628|nr:MULTISPECIES: hypothetical protein [Burkholderia cepacia complex]MBR8084647.1 hypothetical protein [Burkholderia vietnamiensis]MCO8643236.1 hypothetical protein [Burkholderia multivorans]PRG96577.1 hypothetical protein C6V04_05090 [Burkholderia multivorans]
MANVFRLTITAVDNATAVAKKVNSTIAQITKPIADVRASVAAFSKETGMDRLGRSIQKVGIAATESARRVASIAPPIAALTSIGTIAGVVALATSWGRNAVQIANTASVIGISTTQLQRYQGAARIAGLSSDAMTNGLKSVGNAFEDASAGRDNFVAGVLADKGIGIHRLRDGSIDTARALRDVADAAAKIQNSQARGKFLEIFGLGDLNPMLSKGGAALDSFLARYDQLNAIMSPEQIAQGQRYNEEMIALDASVDRLKNSVGAALAPALTQVADAMIPIANEYGPKIAHWIESIDWGKVANDTEQFVDKLGGVKAVAAAVAGITFAAPIAGIVSIIANLTRLTTFVIPAAVSALSSLGAAPIAAAGAGAVAGWGIGKVLRPFYDEYVRKMTGGDRWSLNDYLTGTHRLQLSATGGYTQEELDSVKDGGGAKLTPNRPRTTAPAVPSSTSVPDVSTSVPDASATGRGGRMPLGIRTNNPLNLLTNGRQRVYASPEEGLAAAASNLVRNYKGLSIAQIQDKWTGGARTGNTPQQIANYRAIMTAASGLKANDVPDLSNPSMVARLMVGMIRAENGMQPYSPQQIADSALKGMAGRVTAPVSAPDSMFAATPAAQQTDTQPAQPAIGGKVIVDVNFNGAPKGTSTRVRTQGNVEASAKIGHSGLLGAPV